MTDYVDIVNWDAMQDPLGQGVLYGVNQVWMNQQANADKWAVQAKANDDAWRTQVQNNVNAWSEQQAKWRLSWEVAQAAYAAAQTLLAKNALDAASDAAEKQYDLGNRQMEIAESEYARYSAHFAPCENATVDAECARAEYTEPIEDEAARAAVEIRVQFTNTRAQLARRRNRYCVGAAIAVDRTLAIEEARAVGQAPDQTVEPGADGADRGLPPTPAGSAGAGGADGAGARVDAAARGAAAGAEGDTALSDAPVLQNRDRSSGGAIAQMNAIAANPDPGRLSFSRDFANGAPVVEANPGVDIPQAQLGREDFAIAADGRRIPVQYAVVDAGTLMPSNTADGVPVPGYANGAPDQMRAIAGNGRVAALQAAYERGGAGGYKTGIGADAALTGVSPDVIGRMQKPVLVRIMPREAVTHDIGDVSNTAGTAALSPVEQAANDVHRVDLGRLSFTDAGEPTSEAVREFVRTMPTAEQVGLLNPDGTPTRQAVDRLMAATFQKAYGDPELVRLYAQATDPEARTVLGAMADAAGAMSQLEGAGDLDVRPLVTDAARLAVNARRAGVKLQDFAKQGDIAMSPNAQAFVRLFADNVRSGKRIAEALKRVAEFAHNEASKPNEDMFGKVERATRADVLRKIDDTTRPENLGVAVGREPAQQGAVREAADTAGSADRGPSQEVGTAKSKQTARAGGKRAESLEDRKTRIVAEMDSIEARARERERSGNAKGLPSRTGYNVGDRELVTDWMMAAEREQYHELRKQLPSAGEERQTAAARVREKVAQRRARPAESQADEAPLLEHPTPETLRARVERVRAAKATQERAQREADQRAAADEQAKDFKLTGSERDADRAAAEGQTSMFSRSAQKSVEANVHRGRAAMNRALLDRRDVNRAMYRNDLGWIDFVWGDDKKGLQHIIRQRMTKDGLTEDQATRMLVGPIVETIAHGETHKRSEIPKNVRLDVRYDGHKVALVRRDGRNGWIVTGFELHDKGEGKSSGGRRVGFDTAEPTQTAPTRTRRGLGANDEPSIPPPLEADLSRSQAPPSEGLSVSGAEKTHESLGALRDAWEARGLKVDAHEGRDGTITLSRVVVPEGERGQGVGSEFMHDLTRYADSKGARIALSPSTDFGATSARRLKDFYQRFGFVKNKGRNRNFEVSESMYREPRAADLSRGKGAGLSADDVRRAIANDTLNHNVDVYATLDDAPEYVRRQAAQEGAHDVEGFFDPRTNRVALIAENVASPARAREVARHELIGHYGLENMVGRDQMHELARKVATAERLGNSMFRRIGEEVDRTQPGLHADRRAREMIAMMAERNLHNSIVQRVLDSVRQFLKKIGVLRGDVTDAQIAGMLRDAQAYLRERGRSAVGGELAAAFSKSNAPTLRDLTPINRQRLMTQYREAGKAKPGFDSALHEIAKDVGGYALTPDLKGQERAIDKIVSDYGGDATRIKDLLRGTIVAPNAEAARDIARRIGERFKTVGKPRDNLSAVEPPADGYRDAKFNVRAGDTTAEIQVNVPEMIAAKKQAHALYVEQARIDRDMKANGATPEKEARSDELKQQMREIYDAAWERASRSSATNSSRESGLPLRRADAGSNERGGSVSQAAQYEPAKGSPMDTGMPSPSKSKKSARGESSDGSGSAERAIGDTSENSIADGEPADFSRAGARAKWSW